MSNLNGGNVIRGAFKGIGATIGRWLLLGVILALSHAVAMGAGWPEEVVGARWGQNRAEITKVMSSRSGLKLSQELPDRVVFEGGSVSGMPVKSWTFVFNSGKLTQIAISFSVRQGSDAKGYLANQDFAQLQKQLDAKYGRKKQGKARPNDAKNFEACVWEFPDNLDPRKMKTIELYHGWTPGAEGSSLIELIYDCSQQPVKASGVPPSKIGSGEL